MFTKNFHRALFLVPFLFGMAGAGSLGVLAATEEGCTRPQAVVVTSDLGPEMQCVTTAILNGGLTDPLLIATQCGGLTIATVIAILDVLIAGATNDAGIFTNPDAVSPPPAPAPIADGAAPASKAPLAASPSRSRRPFEFAPSEVTLFRAVEIKARALSPATN